MTDNLRTPDGLPVGLFLSQYYDRLVESAENIIRGNTRFARDQRRELSRELVSLLAAHLLAMEPPPYNCGAFAHRWMKQQVCWQRTAFDKLARLNSHEFDASVPDEAATDNPCDALDGYLPFAGLDPFESAVFGLSRRALTAEEMAEELGVPAGTVHRHLSGIRRKFADARLRELLESGEYIYADEQPVEIRRAIIRLLENDDDSDHSLGGLPDGALGELGADGEAA